MAGNKTKTTPAAGSNKAGGKGKGKEAKKEAGEKGGTEGSKLKPATAINARHVLCEKHAKKEEALEKLRQGTKFDDVAREFSEDKARQGGSLGWKVRGALDAAFEKAAYELEPSTTASPKYTEVKTQHGYHVIMVEGRR
ncbi:Peptidyl-prolyl cis-trans isomerase pin4 [Pseudocyphellaria aurata]|nr:Peptidyl-prolyl cis-trans isomerase pin4 [Pseudocyphellaria aurata]